MKRSPFIGSIVLSIPVFLFAQALQLPLPDGNSTWTIRVTTSGGLSGMGTGDFVVSSEGKVLCSREIRCPKDFATANFQSLVEAIPALIATQSSNPLTSLCNDCITRTMTITRRDAMGIVHTQSTSWNEVTKGEVPKEVIRIYDALVELMK